MRVLGLIALATLIGCTDSTGNGNGSLSLTGTWSGTLTITTSSGPFVSAATLTLVHEGSGVSGTMVFADDDDNEPLNVTGTLSGSTLTLVLTAIQSASDDCHLYPVTVVMGATASTLTAQSASGQVCDGDGMGGHEPLDPVSGASGTLRR